MAKLDQEALAQVVQAVVQALSVQGTAPSPVASAKPADRLAAKDRALVAGFRRKGIPADQIVLMDRSDRSKPHTIKSFQGWLAEGRQVRKGETSVRGLFHQSQCDLIKPSPKAQPKAKAKPVQNKPSQLPLA
jgi:hypothetical protein